MAALSYIPQGRLRAFVQQLWIGPSTVTAAKEHVLPSGKLHLVLRLEGPPMRLYAAAAGAAETHDSRVPTSWGHAVIGGPRTRFYAKVATEPALAVGAVLYPEAAFALFGLPAAELAERHTDLGQVWGSDAERLREQLLACPHNPERLRRFAQALANRVSHYSDAASRDLHPAVAETLLQLGAGATVAQAAAATGFSQRYVEQRFQQQLGLRPKQVARLHRFQHAVALLRKAEPGSNPEAGNNDVQARQPDRTAAVPLVAVALQCGFSDQSHLQREFLAMAGLTPQRYRSLRLAHANHVPIG